MNPAQRSLLARLRELVDETPRSGALNAGGKALYITRFSQAIENRAQDGDALVDYVKTKVHETPTTSYTALIKAGRPDLTVEALVADPDTPWATEFNDHDRQAAGARLGAMLEQHEQETAAVRAEARTDALKLVERVDASRVAKGRPSLTDQQRAEMLERELARRTGTR